MNLIIATQRADDRNAEDARIQLVDGRMFSPLRPAPDAFTPEAIAVGLSNCCRFGMQVRPFYSVAQHSVLVAALCPPDIEVQKFALLHDAEEGFGLPDLPTPLKPWFQSMVDAQHELSRIIFDIYGLDPALKTIVKPNDTIALAIEKRDLKQSRPGYMVELPDPPKGIHVRALQPDQAYQQYTAAWRRVFMQGKPITLEWIFQGAGFTPVSPALT